MSLHFRKISSLRFSSLISLRNCFVDFFVNRSFLSHLSLIGNLEVQCLLKLLHALCREREVNDIGTGGGVGG